MTQPTSETRLREALAVAIIWACTAEGGHSPVSKKYYDWACAIKEKIPGNPQGKEILDRALSSTAQVGTIGHVSHNRPAAEAIPAPAPEQGEPLLKTVERILDDHSAWVAAPNKDVARAIAIAAGVVAQEMAKEMSSAAESQLIVAKNLLSGALLHVLDGELYAAIEEFIA